MITINILVIDSGANIECAKKLNYVPYESDTDYLGHGTTVASIIRAINPDANIYSAKIVDRSGSTVNDKLAQALMYAVSHPEINLINVSLGLPTYSDTIQSIINTLHNRGTRIICAAGNNTPNIYPALYQHTITVGSLNDDNTIASYSAPADIYTYGSVTMNNITYTGTSFSCGIITGILSKGDD